jgi:homocysteine S-methyltransferase
MAKYRTALPQLNGDLFLTDGGIETTIIFLEGHELPYFAAFHLLQTEGGEDALTKYFRTYGALASRLGVGLILEAPTWRSNPDWGAKLGYGEDALADANRKAIRVVERVREEFESAGTPIVISGCIGPRGDGYVPDRAMSADQAEAYHRKQIATFAETSADLVTAITMNYVEEAVGVTRAAQRAGMPVVIAFTVETDGKLPTGQSLAEAIGQVDAATSGYPAYFMINCAHPGHFDHVIQADEPWTARIRGLRANASTMSHAELNEATELDAGNPAALAQAYASLRARKLRQLNVMGGCCGTDDRHVEQIAIACLPAFRQATW